MTTTDPFTDAARAEAPPACEHYWISHSQDSALIPWVIRCGSCGAFNTAEMDRAARAHLAAQEPTDAEVEAAARALWAEVWIDPDEHPWDTEATGAERASCRREARAALSAARAARRGGGLTP